MIKRILNRWARYVWYEDVFIASWLTVFSMLFIDISRFRRYLYRKNILETFKLSCPVIIVGNITVGGTGKTPLVIALAKQLQQAGFRPGIISRGYGGKNCGAISVSADSSPAQVGDEPILIAQKTGCPVAVAVKRIAAAQLLINEADCNIIISDDGLQHYALKRDIEIAVIDGERRFGNNSCLPGGPLREPIERLNEVDFIIVNGTPEETREIPMTFTAEMAIHLKTGAQKPLVEFKGQTCHALAGIGNPARFFTFLAAKGLETINHPFPDHHFFNAKQIHFKDALPVFMTEKDAVKCRAFASDNHWFVPIEAQLPESFFTQLLNLLNKTS
jgi:tetraacyldisaccharide 4'-kinase